MSILTATPAAVNFDLPADAPEADEYRPTAGPDFIPSPADDAAASALFNGEDSEPTDADWDAMAEESAAMDRACLGCYAF